MVWRKFMIGGYTWTIDFADDLRSPGDPTEKLDGVALMDTRRILLESALQGDAERLREVLLHEIVHVVLHDAGLPDEGEDLVDSMGKGLSQALAGFMRPIKFGGVERAKI